MHTIRLRDPWDVEVRADSVLYQRYFNRPTGLEPTSVVRLAIDHLPAGSRVSVNDTSLGAAEAWDITSQLQPRNAVVIEIGGHSLPQRPFGEVRLEIREASPDIG
jgi:hypothetical protein